MRHDYASAWIIHCGNKANTRSATDNNQSPDYGCPMFSNCNNQQSSMWRVLTLCCEWLWPRKWPSFWNMIKECTLLYYIIHGTRIKIPSILGHLTVYNLWRFIVMVPHSSCCTDFHEEMFSIGISAWPMKLRQGNEPGLFKGKWDSMFFEANLPAEISGFFMLVSAGLAGRKIAMLFKT